MELLIPTVLWSTNLGLMLGFTFGVLILLQPITRRLAPSAPYLPWPADAQGGHTGTARLPGPGLRSGAGGGSLPGQPAPPAPQRQSRPNPDHHLAGLFCGAGGGVAASGLPAAANHAAGNRPAPGKPVRLRPGARYSSLSLPRSAHQLCTVWRCLLHRGRAAPHLSPEGAAAGTDAPGAPPRVRPPAAPSRLVQSHHDDGGDPELRLESPDLGGLPADLPGYGAGLR